MFILKKPFTRKNFGGESQTFKVFFPTNEKVEFTVNPK